jgi:hypothetical protein
MSETKGKKSTAYKNRYNAKSYDSLRIVVPKGRKATVEQYAKDHGMSVNGLVNDLLSAAIGITPEVWKVNPDSD